MHLRRDIDNNNVIFFLNKLILFCSIDEVSGFYFTAEVEWDAGREVKVNFCSLCTHYILSYVFA